MHVFTICQPLKEILRTTEIVAAAFTKLNTWAAVLFTLILKTALSLCIDKTMTHNRDMEPLPSQAPCVIIRGNDLLTSSSLWSLHKHYLKKREGLFSRTYIPLGLLLQKLCWMSGSLKTCKHLGCQKAYGYRQCSRTAVKQALYISVSFKPNMQKLSCSKHWFLFFRSELLSQQQGKKNKSTTKNPIALQNRHQIQP